MCSAHSTHSSTITSSSHIHHPPPMLLDHYYSNPHPNFYDADYANLSNFSTFFNDHSFPIPSYYEYPHHQIESFIPSLPPQQPIRHNLIPSSYSGAQILPMSSNISRPLPPEDPELYPKIVKQIEYYFSEENLVKDVYLRKKMDKYGWVDVGVIAEFRKIKQLNVNIYHILEALVSSSVVQVRGYKMRVRYTWKKWILPPNFQLSTRNNNNNNVVITDEAAENNINGGVTELTRRIQNISIGNTTNNQRH